MEWGVGGSIRNWGRVEWQCSGWLYSGRVEYGRLGVSGLGGRIGRDGVGNRLGYGWRFMM